MTRKLLYVCRGNSHNDETPYLYWTGLWCGIMLFLLAWAFPIRNNKMRLIIVTSIYLSVIEIGPSFSTVLYCCMRLGRSVSHCCMRSGLQFHRAVWDWAFCLHCCMRSGLQFNNVVWDWAFCLHCCMRSGLQFNNAVWDWAFCLHCCMRSGLQFNNAVWDLAFCLHCCITVWDWSFCLHCCMRLVLLSTLLYEIGPSVYIAVWDRAFSFTVLCCCMRLGLQLHSAIWDWAFCLHCCIALWDWAFCFTLLYCCMRPGLQFHRAVLLYETGPSVSQCCITVCLSASGKTAFKWKLSCHWLKVIQWSNPFIQTRA